MDKYTVAEVSHKNGYEKGFQDGIKQQQAEIEKLKDILDKKVIEFAYEKKQEIKIEAYKEFANRLKEKYINDKRYDRPNAHTLIDILFANIDITFKELTERKEKKKMKEMCNDNRFELIEKYKQKLIEATNIETSKDEMAVLDDILFRLWQMKWLDKLEKFDELQEEIKTAKIDTLKEFWQRRPPMFNTDVAGKEERNKGWNDCIDCYFEEYEKYEQELTEKGGVQE